MAVFDSRPPGRHQASIRGVNDQQQDQAFRIGVAQQRNATLLVDLDEQECDQPHAHAKLAALCDVWVRFSAWPKPKPPVAAWWTRFDIADFATLARRLAASKIDVVLLEGGGLSLEPSIQALYHGATGAVRYLPLEGVRLRYLGGTTNHWTGQSVPLDATDFDARSWVPDSGWPITYEEYLRHLADARAICEIPAGSFNYEEVARARGIPP